MDGIHVRCCGSWSTSVPRGARRLDAKFTYGRRVERVNHVEHRIPTEKSIQTALLQETRMAHLEDHDVGIGCGRSGHLLLRQTNEIRVTNKDQINLLGVIGL